MKPQELCLLQTGGVMQCCSVAAGNGHPASPLSATQTSVIHSEDRRAVRHSARSRLSYDVPSSQQRLVFASDVNADAFC